MDHRTSEAIHRAAHVVLHSKTGHEAIKAVGSKVIAVAGPLLATPAAPIAIGAAAVGGACLGISKLVKWLNS
jgi:hypothetical protein